MQEMDSVNSNRMNIRSFQPSLVGRAFEYASQSLTGAFHLLECVGNGPAQRALSDRAQHMLTRYNTCFD